MRDSSSSSSSENAGSGEAGTMDDGDVELMKSLEQKSQKDKDKKQRKAFKELRRRGMEERVLLEGSGAATPTDEPQGHRRVVSIEQMQKQCEMIATLARTQNISDAKVNNYLEQAANTIDEAEQLKYMKKAMKRLIALTPQGLDTGSSVGRPPSSPPRKGPKTSKQLRPAAKSAPLASAQQRRLLAHKTSLAGHNSTTTSSSAKASKYYAGNSTSSPKHKVAAASLSDLPLVSTTSASHAQLSKAIKAAGNSSSGSPSDDSVVVLKKLALSSQRIPDGSASGQPHSREASSGTSSTGKRPTFSGPLDSFFSMAKKQKT
ncbi:hypothetical protein BT69DRAFT_21279 [Atractiella rhizophila]|nr:hypothetical protein BT69DRAFT_21279 [Atractiella rhizophila]